MEQFNRKLFKENGKAALKNNFWIIMVVVLLGSFLGVEWSGLLENGVSIPSLNYSYNSTDNDIDETMRDILSGADDAISNNNKGFNFDYDYDDDLDVNENVRRFIDSIEKGFELNEIAATQFFCFIFAITLLILLFVYIIATCFAFAIGSFLSAPVGVGYKRFFMRNRHGKGEFKDLFSAFAKGRYMLIVKNLFFTNIRIWGWSLLFYFPGLYKFYQYFFVKYILSENPGMTPERARELSKEMTDGRKWNIFVMELSFLGWYLLYALAEVVLAIISCGLLAIPGMLLVLPITAYQQASFAELYAERREYAIISGKATKEELPGYMEPTE